VTVHDAMGSSGEFFAVLVLGIVLSLPIAVRVVRLQLAATTIAVLGAFVTLLALIVSWWVVVPGWFWLSGTRTLAHPVVGWSRDPANAASVQALTAIAQVLLGLGLPAFTWVSYRLSTRTAKTMERDRLDASLPVILLKPGQFRLVGQVYESDVVLLNGGEGAALSLTCLWVPASTELGDVDVELTTFPQPTALEPAAALQLTMRGMIWPLERVAKPSQPHDAGPDG